MDLCDYDLPANPEVFITTHRQLNEEGQDHDIVLPDMLNEGQHRVYDYVLDAFANAIGGNKAVSDNVIVMGEGGVGKSFLIRAMEYGIWQFMIARCGRERYPTIRTAVKLAAFTGKAAFQVGGVTIHSLLNLRPNDKLQSLPAETLRRLQRDLKNTHFLFLDEMSMIGLKLLHAIDTRLRRIFPLNTDKSFGGLVVIMFGDFGQLPPVIIDTPLYAVVTNQSSPTLQAASRLYRESFSQVFELTQQMRQQGIT